MNSKDFQSFTQILQYIIKYFKLIVLFAALLILLSGVYIVRSSEEAIVLRFGRITGSTPEKQIKKAGIHFALPFFADEVLKVPVHTVHERELNTHFNSEKGFIVNNIEQNGYLLTGDNNVVLLRVKIKYQIKDTVKYILSSSDAERIIDGVVSAQMTKIVTNMDIDSILTSGIAHVSIAIAENSQIVIDELNLGVNITNVELTGIMPPVETIRYFEEVRNAAVVKQTSIQQAYEKASLQILSAQAQSSAAKQDAISYQNEKITKARAEMAEFYGLYNQYARNPQIIINGTFRQRTAAVFAMTGASIIVPQGSGAPVIVLP